MGIIGLLNKASKKAVSDFFYHFVSKYGAPVTLIIDNGHFFNSDIFKARCIKLEIFHVFTVPFHSM